MPNTKSSTSSEPTCPCCCGTRCDASREYARLEADRDKYKLLLEELLAEIHRDGGQFTKLAGLMTSLEGAHKIVVEQRCKITRLLTATRAGR